MNTCSIGAHLSGHVALSKHPVICCPAGFLIRYGSTLRALMTIGSSCYACRNRQERESKPCRRYWSFFISKKSGLPIRVGRRRGRALSNGSTACNRSSPGVPIAAFVLVPSGSRAAQEGAYTVFPELLHRAFRNGSPSPWDVLPFLAYWPIPQGFHRRLRGLFRRWLRAAPLDRPGSFKSG